MSSRAPVKFIGGPLTEMFLPIDEFEQLAVRSKDRDGNAIVMMPPPAAVDGALRYGRSVRRADASFPYRLVSSEQHLQTFEYVGKFSGRRRR